MQQANQAAFRRYVLAGDQIIQRGSINVSSHVHVENEFDQDDRSCYHAKNEENKTAGIQMKWAFPVLLLAVMIVLCMMAAKISLTEELKQEYAQLRNRYAAAETERQKLADDLEEKMNSSGICYYAVQSLGMSRATTEETIGVRVSGAQAALPEELALHYLTSGHQ